MQFLSLGRKDQLFQPVPWNIIETSGIHKLSIYNDIAFQVTTKCAPIMAPILADLMVPNVAPMNFAEI